MKLIIRDFEDKTYTKRSPIILESLELLNKLETKYKTMSYDKMRTSILPHKIYELKGIIEKQVNQMVWENKIKLEDQQLWTYGLDYVLIRNIKHKWDLKPEPIEEDLPF